MKKNFTKTFTVKVKEYLRGHLFSGLGMAAIGLLLSSSSVNAQATVLIPASGSNTVPCGQLTRLMDHAGTSNYSDNVDGFTVIDAGFAGVINIQGPYVTESCCDPIRIYSGAGISGPLLGQYQGTGSLNYTGTSGQTLTVRFTTDGSVVYSGLDFTVSSTGACFASPCSGAPGANTVVVTPTAGICPGASAFLALQNSYNVGGLQFQWASSTVSNVGPFTPIANATLTTYNTPTLNTPVYYTAVITCTNGNITTTATAGQVLVQGTTISQIPYFEGFEGIISTNQLPNCSWTSTSPNTVSRTYTATQNQQRSARTGNKFASFYYSPSGTNYFFTNGIQMYAGVTYSASVWFKTNYYGDLNWADLSIMLGTSQTTTGLVNLASTNGPAASTAYMPVSNTFTVANSGIYYVAIRGTSSGGCCAYHLNWDDLQIIAPCSINSPTVAINSSTTTICSGDPVTLTATGAQTYAWSHGPTTAVINENPTQNTLYSVVGTNTISGCTTTVNQYIVVNQAPQITIFADKQTVCAGQPAVLTALGALTYSWNTGPNTNFITVTPATATSYTVMGMNSAGCLGQSSQLVNVNPLPNVSGTSDKADICKGESATLTGAGAVTYQWAANTLFIISQSAIVSPQVPTVYTLTGTDANGCQKVVTVTQNVLECVGINEVTTTQLGVKVYPNPTSGLFTVELSNDAEKTVEVLDVTGRVVLTNTSKAESLELNVNNLSNGIYYVRITSENAVEVIKVVKN